MGPHHTGCFALFWTFPGCHDVLESYSPSYGLFQCKWAILGPPWVPIWPQGGPTWHIIIYYTLGNCFRAIRNLPDRYRAPVSVSSSGGVSGTKKFNFAVVKKFSGTYQPRPISKCRLVLTIYFRAFSSILEVMFFWKMAICEYLILVIFGQFWLFRANFGPGNSKEYFFQLFRCKKNNGIIKSGSVWLFQKLVPLGTPKPTPAQKDTQKAPGEPKLASMLLMQSN